MAITIVRHKVKDYAAWRKAFNGFESARKKAGEKTATVVQVDGNPNDVIVINTWPSIDSAKQFFALPDLKKGMEAAGVASLPEFVFGSES